MNEPIVAVENLTKRYAAVTAVDGISFEVRRGEVFGLLGPNGAGKTSTLECIEGIRHYEGGRISVAGADVRKDVKAVRKLLGVQLQSSSLPDNIRASEAMSLICSWHGMPVRDDLLEKFDLGKEPKKQYTNMSTGQKRRLHLALALAVNPAVVVLDEPTRDWTWKAAPSCTASSGIFGTRELLSCWPPTTWPRPRSCATGSPS